MDVFRTIFGLIDPRSFSSLWFWIALAVTWSSASHWVIGVPFDMVVRARREGGDAAVDLATIAAINVRRILHVAREAGPWLIGLAAFSLTLLGLLGFAYGIEFAQACFLLLLPMIAVGALSVRTAAAIEGAGAEDADGWADLAGRLGRHRLMVQGLGVVSIFVTALWGMWQNLNLSEL